MACSLPLFVFGFGNAYFDYQADRAEAGRRALNMTRSLALLVQRDLEARLSTLQVLAMSQALQAGDIASFRVRAAAVLRLQLPGANIVLLREDGQQVMNTALPAGAALPARRDNTSLHLLFATAQPSVSDIFISVVDRPTLALDVPVRSPDGSVLYSLTLNPTLAAFADIVHREQLWTGSIVSILDRQGVTIARTPHDERFVGKKVGPILMPRLLTESEGVIETVSADGVPVIAAFSHVPVFGWAVTIGLPRAELIDTARRAAWLTFGVGAACLVLGLALAQAMVRRVAAPIASLGALCVGLEQDDPDVSAATGLAETDQVAQALIAAASKRHAAETAARKAEAEREQGAALLRTVIESTPSLIFAKDCAGRMVLANGAFLAFLGKTWAEVAGRTDLEFFDDRTEAKAVMENDRRIMAAGRAEACEELVGKDGNRPRVWLSTKTPLRNADREVIGLVAVSVEITERKQVEDRLRQMVNELNHRVKNTLATVQSIASHTLRGADRTFRQTLEARLLALASAHDILTREGWEGANLTDVIAGALMPYGSADDDRFRVSGPPLRLQPRAAVALAMALHELATNALKYGALSVAGGRVEIRWEVRHVAPAVLHIVWSEQRGPAVDRPGPPGFGTSLIERSLAQDLGGTAQITFPVDGITCVIDAPLAEVLATSEILPFPLVGNM
ncbi:MAG TPA: HWE histidine kinase domain-containing protein [Rhodopila sp.]